MLVVHETHRVAGREAEAFADLLRDGWREAGDDGVRLLWSLEQAHGTGPSYTFVTIIGVALARRPRPATTSGCGAATSGDWWTELDALPPRVGRQGARADRVLAAGRPRPRPGCRRRATTCTAPQLPLFMEDTAWPHPGRLRAPTSSAPARSTCRPSRRAAEHGVDILELVAAFTPLVGAGPEREVVLWQRVGRPELLLPLLSREVPARAPRTRAPGCTTPSRCATAGRAACSGWLAWSPLA